MSVGNREEKEYYGALTGFPSKNLTAVDIDLLQTTIGYPLTPADFCLVRVFNEHSHTTGQNFSQNHHCHALFFGVVEIGREF